MIKPMVGVTLPSSFINSTGMALLPSAFMGAPSVVTKAVLSSFRLKVYCG